MTYYICDGFKFRKPCICNRLHRYYVTLVKIFQLTETDITVGCYLWLLTLYINIKIGKNSC